MSPKNVLLLADSPYMGGVTAHLLSVAEAFAERQDYVIHPATLPGRREDDALAEGARRRGLRLHTFPMSWRGDWRVLGQLRRYVRDLSIDVIHIHGYRGAILCRLAGIDKPIINTCHGMLVAPSFRLRLWQAAELRIMRGHALTIACSDFVRSWLIEKGVPEGQTRTIRHGYAPPERPDVEITRASLGIHEDAMIAVYLGRLVAGKGLEVLLEALSRAKGCTLVAAGEGPLRKRLASQTRAAGIDAKFVGGVEDPTPYYALADVVVLPSAMEALPMALIEAAAHRKPVIACPVGGVPEIVRHGETGILVEHGNVAQLADALEQCRAPEKRAALGQAAHISWKKEFTPTHMAEELGKAYDEALGRM